MKIELNKKLQTAITFENVEDFLTGLFGITFETILTFTFLQIHFRFFMTFLLTFKQTF